MRIVRVIVMATFLLGCLAGAASAATTVEHIAVQVVTVSGQQAPPARIAKRMSASVETIGENVLFGKSVDELADKQESYENLVKEVFDRILVGYSVQKVTIKPGTTTNITVVVEPWGDIVQDTAVELDFSGVDPALVPLLAKDIGDIQTKVKDVLVGLPVDAIDWAGGVSRSMIREILADRLPEYRANFDIVAGPRTVVKVSLIPQGTIIQNVTVSLHSQSIPNFLLLQARTSLESGGNILVGLPVEFVDRHRDYFMARVMDEARKQSAVERFGLTVKPVISPGGTTNISLEVETNRYHISLEGYMDIGRSADNNTWARLHVGKQVSKSDEAFFEVNLIPSSVTSQFLPGWGHRIASSTVMGLKYNINDRKDILFMNQDIGDRWMLRMEHTTGSDTNELGVRYKLHEFLSAEYVFSDKDSWLRLIGNL